MTGRCLVIGADACLCLSLLWPPGLSRRLQYWQERWLLHLQVEWVDNGGHKYRITLKWYLPYEGHPGVSSVLIALPFRAQALCHPLSLSHAEANPSRDALMLWVIAHAHVSLGDHTPCLSRISWYFFNWLLERPVCLPLPPVDWSFLCHVLWPETLRCALCGCSLADRLKRRGVCFWPDDGGRPSDCYCNGSWLLSCALGDRCAGHRAMPDQAVRLKPGPVSFGVLPTWVDRVHVNVAGAYDMLRVFLDTVVLSWIPEVPCSLCFYRRCPDWCRSCQRTRAAIGWHLTQSHIHWLTLPACLTVVPRRWGSYQLCALPQVPAFTKLFCVWRSCLSYRIDHPCRLGGCPQLLSIWPLPVPTEHTLRWRNWLDPSNEKLEQALCCSSASPPAQNVTPCRQAWRQQNADLCRVSGLAGLGCLLHCFAGILLILARLGCVVAARKVQRGMTRLLRGCYRRRSIGTRECHLLAIRKQRARSAAGKRLPLCRNAQLQSWLSCLPCWLSLQPPTNTEPLRNRSVWSRPRLADCVCILLRILFQMSPAGPKSGMRPCRCSGPLFISRTAPLLLLCIMACLLPGSQGVRVDVVNPTTSEPGAFPEDHHVLRSPGNPGFEPYASSYLSSRPTSVSSDCLSNQVGVSLFSHARKRAYKRAVHRAERDGGTMYRGRWHTSDQLGAQYAGKAKPSCAAIGPHSLAAGSAPRVSQGFRLRFMTYNVGGLATDAYDVFMAAMLQTPEAVRPHIVCLQETHWKHSSEYSTQGWHVITSSCPSEFRSGGLMVMISHALVPAAQAHRLAFQEVLVGRLIHVRIHLGDQAVDVVNTYQSVSTGPKPVQHYASFHTCVTAFYAR